MRSRAVDFGIEPPLFDRRDIHVHVPEGATPKDGPSAGVGMATVIVSMLTGIPVRHDIAMTGEITLRGLVPPIGGLKEKLLAALRGGMKKVLIPEENAKDLAEIPISVKNALEIVPVSRMDEVLMTRSSASRADHLEEDAQEGRAARLRTTMSFRGLSRIQRIAPLSERSATPRRGPQNLGGVCGPFCQSFAVQNTPENPMFFDFPAAAMPCARSSKHRTNGAEFGRRFCEQGASWANPDGRDGREAGAAHH